MPVFAGSRRGLPSGFMGSGRGKGDRISTAYKLKTDGLTRPCMGAFQPFSPKTKKPRQKRRVSGFPD